MQPPPAQLKADKEAPPLELRLQRLVARRPCAVPAVRQLERAARLVDGGHAQHHVCTRREGALEQPAHGGLGALAHLVIIAAGELPVHRRGGEEVDERRRRRELRGQLLLCACYHPIGAIAALVAGELPHNETVLQAHPSGGRELRAVAHDGLQLLHLTLPAPALGAVSEGEGRGGGGRDEIGDRGGGRVGGWRTEL